MARKRKAKQSKSQKARARRQREQRATAGKVPAGSPGPAAPTLQPILPPSPAPDDLAKLGTFLTDLRKEKAAQLLAQNDVSMVDIAAAVGVTREAIRLWQQEPDFAARVEELSKELAEMTRRFLVTRKFYRLADLQEHLRSIHRVIAARASDPAHQAAPGGDTGLLVRRQRMIGSGDNAMLIEEFEFDASVARERRDTLKQVAQEIGDWVNKVAPTTPDGKDEYSGIPAPDREAFRKLPLAERVRLLRSPVRSHPMGGDEQPPEGGVGSVPG